MLFFDPNGARLHRHAAGFAVSIDGRDVVRCRTGTVWLFHTDPPTSYQTEQLYTLPEFDPFVHPPGDAGAADLAGVESSAVAGRATWRVPFGETVIDVDQLTGVVLRVAVPGRTLSAAEVEIPTAPEDTAWHGPAQPFEIPAPPEPPAEGPDIPGRIPALPPVSEGCVRVTATDMILEGAIPAYRPGNRLEETLSLIRDEDGPVHRGFVVLDGRVYKEPGGPSWSGLAIGDGWFAGLALPTPSDGWQDIPGTLHLTGWAAEERPVPMIMEKVYAKVVLSERRDRHLPTPTLWQEIGPDTPYVVDPPWRADSALLDVRPAPPPTPVPAVFRPGASGADASTVWQADETRPVVRAWSLTSGNYLGEVLLPAPAETVLTLQGNAARSDTAAWALRIEDGAPTADPLNPLPELPDGWSSLQPIPGGEYVQLHRWDDSGHLHECALRRLSDGKICPVSTHPIEVGVTGELVHERRDGELLFFDPATTRELTRVPEPRFPRVALATREHIVVVGEEEILDYRAGTWHRVSRATP